MKEIRFSHWLVQAFELANKRPIIWLGCVLFLAGLMPLARISLAMGILFSITSLLLGVGIVDAIQHEDKTLAIAIKKQMPLASGMAFVLTLFWFVFRVFSNINVGEEEKIFQFFFNWELIEANFQDKVFRQVMVWLYSAAMVSLIFVLLMFASLGSWFSYPLMLFKQCSWSEARELGRKAHFENTLAMYQLMFFLFLTGLIGIGLMPLLTPLFYMLVSTLMYVSYYDIFVKK